MVRASKKGTLALLLHKIYTSDSVSVKKKAGQRFTNNPFCVTFYVNFDLRKKLRSNSSFDNVSTLVKRSQGLVMHFTSQSRSFDGFDNEISRAVIAITYFLHDILVLIY
jgi:hypothetical protein